MRRLRKNKEALIRLIVDLKKSAHENDAPIWKDVAKRLERPSKSWA